LAPPVPLWSPPLCVADEVAVVPAVPRGEAAGVAPNPGVSDVPPAPSPPIIGNPELDPSPPAPSRLDADPLFDCDSCSCDEPGAVAGSTVCTSPENSSESTLARSAA